MTRQKTMVRHLVLLLMVISFVLILAQRSAFGASVPYATGIINDPDGANIRSTYATDGNVVGGAPYQGYVLVTKERFTSSTSTAKTTRWYYVQSSYGDGWIRSDLLDISYGKIEGKIKDTVNIRKGAGTSFGSVTTLDEGDTVHVRLTVYSSSGYKWYKIYYNQYYRYVRATYVELQEPEPDESPAPTINENFDTELALFPSSYHAALKTLHEKYPTWHFKANNLNFSWNDALEKMTRNYGTNTIPSSKPDAYKAVAKETYNFDDHYYYGFDGSSWVAASEKAVAHYMDPRNWLDENNIFMFESLHFDPESQKESMVKDLLASTAIPTKNSSSYMEAGVTYNINPVYLAAKSRLELGSSSFMVDGHQFTYGGKTYKGYYNAYNIGASDSASGSAALNGLYYAASGTSYLRPWNTLDKAIRGGAKFIADDFIGNNQHTAYYEHFNVANDLGDVGTHVYMTNTMAAATHANITYWDYSDNKMLDTAFTFEIPVYQSMTSKPAAAPGSGNNNCFLDSLKVYDGDTRKYFTISFDRFTRTYTLKKNIPYETEELKIKAVTNADDAKVSISGNSDFVVGDNKITVKVTSSSGMVKRYYIKLKKSEPTTVIAPEVKLTNNASTGKPVLSWEAAPNADKYEVYRSTSKNGEYKLLKTMKGHKFTNTSAVAGKTYYYKVKAIGIDGVVGEAFSEIVYRTCDLSRPAVKASNVESTGKIRLNWDKIEGTKEYVVYRATSKSGTYEKLYTTTGTTFRNTSAKAGKSYYYKVKAISNVKSAANSAYSEIVYITCDLPQPVVKVSNISSTGKVKLSWTTIDGAKSYEVYRATSKSGTYKKLYTTTGTAFKNTSAKAGKTYYYKVKAVSKFKSAANSAYSKMVYRTCDLPKPVVKASNVSSTGKVKLSWTAIDGAKSYEVYRATSKSGTYKKLYTTTGTAFKNTSAKAGTRYYYKVKAVSKVKSAANSAYSEMVYRTCDLRRPVVTIKLRSKDGKPRLTWKEVEGAGKYKVYRATSKNGTYKLIYTKKGTAFTNTAAKSGKTYYYKVKAIYSKSSNANSAFSLKKSITSE